MREGWGGGFLGRTPLKHQLRVLISADSTVPMTQVQHHAVLYIHMHVFQEVLIQHAVNTYTDKAWLDSLVPSPFLNTKPVSIK